MRGTLCVCFLSFFSPCSLYLFLFVTYKYTLCFSFFLFFLLFFPLALRRIDQKKKKAKTNCLCNTQSVLTGGLTSAGSDVRDSVTVRSNNAAELSWSRCTGADGNPGILNVNFRPVVQGDYGTYDFKRASWKLEWRKC